jgi:hypothetical protein
VHVQTSVVVSHPVGDEEEMGHVLPQELTELLRKRFPTGRLSIPTAGQEETRMGTGRGRGGGNGGIASLSGWGGEEDDGREG